MPDRPLLGDVEAQDLDLELARDHETPPQSEAAGPGAPAIASSARSQETPSNVRRNDAPADVALHGLCTLVGKRKDMVHLRRHALGVRRVRRSQISQRLGDRRTVMRYARLPFAVPPLTFRVVSPAFGRSPIFPLVVATIRPPGHGRALDAEAIASVAVRADPHLRPAAGAHEDPGPLLAVRAGLDGLGMTTETLSGLRRLPRHDPPGAPDCSRGPPPSWQIDRRASQDLGKEPDPRLLPLGTRGINVQIQQRQSSAHSHRR
jgi:hypothetical protein